MTATVAIQSAPSKAVQSVESSIKTASANNKNETSNVENEKRNSFKDLYDDAKKVDNTAESETKKHEVADAAGKKSIAEDGKSLPLEDKASAADDVKEASLNKQTERLDEYSSQDLLVVEQLPSLNLDETGANGDSIVIGISEQLKGKQSLDSEDKNTLSVLTGLNHTEQPKLNIAIEEQDLKLALNNKRLNDVSVMVPGTNTRSLAQHLSLTKTGDGLAKKGGLNEALTLSPAQLTDELMMSDMDKAFNKVISTEKLSLDAMLGKLETLTSTTADSPRPSTAAPLSTALNHSSTSITQGLSGVNQATITETLGKPEWNQSMSKQISWMASQNIRSAEIKLTPANLGTIEVRVEMNEDKLNIAFSSRDAGVRDSVEQAMPKLREMLEEQGLDLGETDVSEQTFFEQQEERFSQQGSMAKAFNGESGLPDADASHVEESLMRTVTTSSMAAVDYYI